MLIIVDNLFFALIDCMFGGTGKLTDKTKGRDFTTIEQRVMRKFINEILKNLEKSWEIVHSVRIMLKKMESNPDFVHLVAPEDLVMAIGFSIIGPEYEGNIYVCIPYLMLEPIKDKLSHGKRKPTSEPGTTWNHHLQGILTDTIVNIKVELAKSQYTIRDILNLEVGNILKFNSGPEDTVSVKVENVVKYKGFPGVVKGNRAVQISNIMTGNKT